MPVYSFQSKQQILTPAEQQAAAALARRRAQAAQTGLQAQPAAPRSTIAPPSDVEASAAQRLATARFNNGLSGNLAPSSGAQVHAFYNPNQPNPGSNLQNPSAPRQAGPSVPTLTTKGPLPNQTISGSGYNQQIGAIQTGLNGKYLGPNGLQTKPPPQPPVTPPPDTGNQPQAGPSVNDFSDLDKQYAAELAAQQAAYQAQLGQALEAQRAAAGFSGLGLSGAAQAQEGDLRGKMTREEQQSLSDLASRYRNEARQNQQLGEESDAFHIAEQQLESQLGVDLNGDGVVGFKGQQGTGADSMQGQPGQQPPTGYHRRSNNPNDPGYLIFDKDGSSAGSGPAAQQGKDPATGTQRHPLDPSYNPKDFPDRGGHVAAGFDQYVGSDADFDYYIGGINHDKFKVRKTT